LGPKFGPKLPSMHSNWKGRRVIAEMGNAN